MIKLIDYIQFPEDNYTKELVYLEIDGKRFAYVAKMGKSGHTFWAPVSIGITRNGKKEYFPAFMFDSNFLEKDIKAFLESRPWNKTNISTVTNPQPAPAPTYRTPYPEVQDDLPF